MDPVNVIRAPSLKRGKPDERLSDRVSIEFSFRLIIMVIRTRVCDCLTDMSNNEKLLTSPRKEEKEEIYEMRYGFVNFFSPLKYRRRNVIKNIVSGRAVRREMEICCHVVAVTKNFLRNLEV